MKIVVKKLSELKRFDKNIRRHPEKQLAEYIRSINMFGQIKPVIVDEDGLILAGNGLYEALIKMGRETCDCCVIPGLTMSQKKKLMLSDNKVYELGITDTDIFEEIIKELDGDIDVPGWDADLLAMLNSTATEATEQIESYGVFAEEDVSPITKRTVQEHRPINEETRSYASVAPPPDQKVTPSAPTQEAQHPTPAASMEPPIPDQPQIKEAGRFIICPKCGKRICL